MNRRVFVSYNYDDRDVVHTVDNFQRQGAGGLTFVRVERDVSRGHATEAARDRAIDEEILRVMKGCEYALFLIGNNNHNSPWILREIQLAKSIPLPMAVARVPNSIGGVPVSLLGCREVKFEPQAVRDALLQRG